MFNKGILLIFVIIVCISCENKATSNNSCSFYLNLNLSSVFEHNLAPDSLKLEFISDNDQQSYTLINLISEFEQTFQNLINEQYRINATLFFDDGDICSAYSKINFGSEEMLYGKLYAEFAFTKFILKLDTNPLTSSDIDVFNNLDTRNQFYKERYIENVNIIAYEYSQTPMEYFKPFDIIYALLDENMIPIVQYSFGSFRNPVITCNNLFGCYREFVLTGDPIYLEWFYNNVDWLLEFKDENSYLKYEFAWNHAGRLLDVGWISAMAQGEALAAVCMAYHNSGDEKYLDAAHGFFKTLYCNSNDLWCIGIDDEDYIWFEEYPNEDFCHVLNGKLFGMWGLWDYYCITGNEIALSLFQGGLASILDNYPIWNYEGEDASVYCKHLNEPTNYHYIHIFQLTKYRDFFQIEEFNDIIEAFTEY